MTCDSMVKKPQKPFYASEEKVKELNLLLVNNSDILKNPNPKVKNLIIPAFRFKNNAAFIELYERKTEKVTNFIKRLEAFFFVGEAYFYPEPKDSKIFGVIILSRFKNLLDVGMHFAIKYKGPRNNRFRWHAIFQPRKRICILYAH